MSNKCKSRREFLKSIVKGTASTASLMAFGPLTKSLKADTRAIDPRVRVPNPFVNQSGHPLLVCVEGTDFQQMLAMGLSAIGGLDLLIDNNQDVLIKPNLVTVDELEPYPTISDVNSILALLDVAQQVTTGTIGVGDAGGMVPVRYYELLGLDPAVPESGGVLVDFIDTYDVRRSTWSPEIPDFLVFTDVYDTPLIINLCNLKRHNCTYFTCALKNNVGTVDGPYEGQSFGPTRDYLHGFDWLSDEFLQTVSEIAGVVNSELTIVDARLVMAIDGPMISPPYIGEIREMNKIVICGDPVATDAYCAQLLADIDETFEASTIEPTLTRAEELGLGTADLGLVEIIELSAGLEKYQWPHPKPDGFVLYQNHPNPFNRETTLAFYLPKATRVNLTVHDIAGRKVKTLINGWMTEGAHNTTFDPLNLASGRYIYRMQTPEYASCGMMSLIK